jgi:UDP-4-amino-4,6-dideoxy-N-acetyl-beta-L-altrosamine transaminase
VKGQVTHDGSPNDHGGRLALHGGPPIRRTQLQYGRQTIDDADVAAVTEVLRSDWLTTGPKVSEFEGAFAAFVGSREAVAVCNGTAALHASMFALEIGMGDEVIAPSMTFAASMNCAVFQGATPVFADVCANTLLLDPYSVEERITARTKAIVAVDYAGQPCDYRALQDIADHNGVTLVADACHSLGASYRGRLVGSVTKLSAFSLHPVKPMTTGEGGVVTTDDGELASRMRRFRGHGIDTDFRQREEEGAWFYQMVDLGYNYRLTDFQCALGVSQLRKLPSLISRRREIAQEYAAAFEHDELVRPLTLNEGVSHGYHLYVVELELDRISVDRTTIFAALRAEGIGVNVHYCPAHLHPFYRKRYGFQPGDCPVAEGASERILSLPIFPSMDQEDVRDVIGAVRKVLEVFAS